MSIHTRMNRESSDVPLPEPKYGYCPACGEAIHNRGAHAEACRGDYPPGPVVPYGSSSGPPIRDFIGWYSCGCPDHGWTRAGGRCENMRDRRPVYRPGTR